jgi:Uma2 family endonuclease
MIIRQHSSLRASDRSMPEPDIAVIPRRRGFHHPNEAFLIVEVSDSSLRNDRAIKSRIYARAKILEYWIVDVQHERVEVLTEPNRKGYVNTRVFGRGEVLRPAALPDFSVTVDAIFDC